MIGIAAMYAVAGAGVAAVYLALLWAATRALTGSRSGLIFVALAVVRAALVIGALAAWAAIGAGMPALVAGLAGFLAMRLVATRTVRPRAGGSAWR